MSDADILAIGREAVECFRDNGVPTIPDPILEDGRLTFPEGVEAQIEAQYPPQVLDAAQQACQSIIDQLPQPALGAEPGTVDADPLTPAEIEARLRFAECMRDNGVPDWPDPLADGTWPEVGNPLVTEGKSPRIQAGFDACRQDRPGSVPPS
jgi:hypothetical protein